MKVILLSSQIENSQKCESEKIHKILVSFLVQIYFYQFSTEYTNKFSIV